MKTGILGGFLTGTALSALVLGVASVLTYPEASAPEATEVAVPAGSEFRQSREDTQASLPGSDETPDPAEQPQIAAPEPDDLASLDETTTESAAQPESDVSGVGLTAPDAPDAPVGLDLDVEEPVLASPQSLAPQAPDSEEDLSISTEPAQPVQPDIDENAAFEPDQQAALVPDTQVQPDIPAEIAPDAPASAAPDVETESVEPDVAPDTGPEDGSASGIAAAPETPSEETEGALADAQSDAASVAEPSGTIGNLADGVTVGRLPSVSAATEEDVEADTQAPEEGTAAGEPTTPLERFAADFDNPEGKPLLSFILLDQGDSPINFDALADFPYPISYAIDVTWPGAAAAMAQYRAAGLEVLAMVDLPEGASAVDTEVAMQTYLSALPETVAIMEGVGSGLQANREATEQLIPILLESGHGLVLFSEGLDTAQKLVAREGVPALSVFRDIDSNGQSATVIRRFLDQAAFRAGQEEAGVIIVGRLRAETVSALLLWGLQDRANSVAIAPVSALLQRQAPE